MKIFSFDVMKSQDSKVTVVSSKHLIVDKMKPTFLGFQKGMHNDNDSNGYMQFICI